MTDFDSVLVGAMSRLLDHSKSYSLRSEDEVRGFLVANLMRDIPSLWKLIQEMPTEAKYKRSGNSLIETSPGRSGRIDIVIRATGGKSAGIEIEYPRGKGLKDRDTFISHLRNDLLKLGNERSFLRRYLIVFLYGDPPVDRREIEASLAPETEKTKVAILRMAKASQRRESHPLIWSTEMPARWLLAKTRQLKDRG